MAKHTIELGEREIRIIRVVRSVVGCSNIDKAISFIVEDYGKTKEYSKFIDKKIKELENEKSRAKI